MEVSYIKKQIFVSCPFDLLKRKYFKRIVEERINPEIGLNGTVLDDYTFKDFKEVAAGLNSSGLTCTIHAPFTDVSIGAIDKKVRRVSIERLKRAIDIAVIFDAVDMVFHSGWERKIYADMLDTWLENATESLLEICEYAEKSSLKIMLENVFELDPHLHLELFNRVNQEVLGFCLDVGHVYAFSKTKLNKWIELLGNRIGHLHLHDNNGDEDEHLAPGSGIIDFDVVFSWLSERNKRPTFTLEAHDEESVIPGLIAIGGLIAKYYK